MARISEGTARRRPPHEKGGKTLAPSDPPVGSRLAAGPILNDERLAEPLGEPLPDQAHKAIAPAAGGIATIMRTGLVGQVCIATGNGGSGIAALTA